MKQSQMAKKLQFADIDPETSYVEWLMKYSRELLYGALAFLVLVIAFFWATHRSASDADYVEAAAAFSSLQNGQVQALPNLQTLVNAHQELQQQYDASIAQTLLYQGKTNDALPFAHRALERTKADQLPYYQDFAATTLLIAQQDFTKALAQTNQQKASLLQVIREKQERPFGDTLFALTLLRLALLQQMVNSDAEKAAWAEWNLYANNDPSVQAQGIDSQVFVKLQQDIALGKVNLGSYIESRLKSFASKE